MNYRRTFERMAREMDVLTLEVISEGATQSMLAFLRLMAQWWTLQRWWMFTVEWSPLMVAISRRKRRVIAEHARCGIGPPFVAEAMDRAAWQCIYFDLERRVSESDRPWRWCGELEWQQRQEREALIARRELEALLARRTPEAVA